jgi:predicted ArsR family transcriptional regulator
MNPTQKLIVKFLTNDDLSVKELGAKINMHPECVRHSLKILIKIKIVKHVDWKPQKRGRPYKLYSSNMKRRNAREYEALTGAQKVKRHRDKYKALINYKRRINNKKAKKIDISWFIS